MSGHARTSQVIVGISNNETSRSRSHREADRQAESHMSSCLDASPLIEQQGYDVEVAIVCCHDECCTSVLQRPVARKGRERF